MKMTDHPHKLLWAFDPSDGDRTLEIGALKMFLAQTVASGFEIEPVLALCREEFASMPPVSPGEKGDQGLIPNSAVSRFLGTTGFSGIPFPKILIQNGTSRNKNIECLLLYAREVGAQALVVCAHASRTWRDALLGNFADSLLLRSEIPVLSLPPAATASGESCFDRILFPTDFSQSSFMAFQALLPMAISTEARVLLFYKCDYVIRETLDLLHGVPLYSEFMRRDIDGHAAMARQWQDVALTAKVPVEFIVDESAGFLEPSILTAAETHRATMIAVTSRQHRSAPLIFRDVPLEISHQTRLPVWAFHPNHSGTGVEEPVPFLGSSVPADVGSKGKERSLTKKGEADPTHTVSH